MTPQSLKGWRERLRITKIKAARKLEIGRNTYARYESGEVKIPEHIALACAAIENLL